MGFLQGYKCMWRQSELSCVALGNGQKKKIHWSLSVQNPADNKGTFYPISLGGSLMVHPIKKKTVREGVRLSRCYPATVS